MKISESGIRLGDSRVAYEHVPEIKLSDLEFPMTTDLEKLQEAWKTVVSEVTSRARNSDAAFVTLSDPCIYSTFGHLCRTLREPRFGVNVAVIPETSSATAVASVLGVDIDAVADLTLREATDGAAPIGPV